jgi:hypothetical protein
MGVSQFIYDEKCFYQGKMMVPRASALSCAGHNYCLLLDCDHFTVCRPIDKCHMSYEKLVSLIQVFQEQVSSIDSLNPFVAFLLIMNFADLFDILG